MNITVRYFASIREAMGTSSESLTTTATTVGALREELMARSEAAANALAHGKAVRMALNQEMCQGDAALKAGDEVAFFPPVTGG
ncbi:molybdopterin converting factor subunit 1 [Comamonas kerstersii]|uniref:Molybdopterin synthase sulfur carrier subunit n=1 Tax=Comamonas kerstersii TaxID=225992 RepID=A0A0W7YXB8_9BURK|nr:molybdopterin converting factor subunit 1 [Comamonas kerstersii]MDO4968699.1 molybdopterin converting factor subunit 1 [Comamonadaceae bacterium]AQZ97194.1 molybdopterin synthase sulfur carrier subunit [Comamonas kerstersii]KUF39846.1 molybdopterin synthase sulfur carrier subunit [Comamonas kerstersii]OOH88314.1 molybdopterin converting factor subunit 1 [Comamonas kerstersii]OOH91682.1 molybdopterin converting factor subunit 1 [Comamonas kerstersii]